MGMFASESPGFYDDLLLIDSTPVECARSRETVKRSQLRRRRGLRLLPLALPLLLGLPAARDLRPRRHPESAAARLAEDRRTRSRPRGCSTVCAATAARSCSATRATPAASSPPQVSERGATLVRPRRKDEPGQGPHLAPIRQRIESIFWTCKDLLTLERHGARTLNGLRERVLARFCCLAAAITLNHKLGRPSRALVNYCA